MAVVFVIGPPRGGTTLMLELLELHPRVTAHAHDFALWHHDSSQLRGRHAREEHFRYTTGDVTAALRERYRAEIGRHLGRWRRSHFVLKLSTLSMQVDYLRALVPEARFIQMVREPRDAICSSEDLRRGLQAQQEEPRLLGPAADPFGLWCAETFADPYLRAGANWYYHATRSLLDLRYAGDDSFLRVRYEDFVAAPEATMRRVLDFLGLEISWRLAWELRRVGAMPGSPRTIGFSTTQATGKRIGRYVRDLPAPAAVALSPLLALPMRLFGYEPVPVASDEDVAAACRALGADPATWLARVEREVRWFERHWSAFAPERMLRQDDTPTPASRPLLIDGAFVGTDMRIRDGEVTQASSFVAKQSRRHVFPDVRAVWPRLAPRLDGTTRLDTLCAEAGVTLDEELLEVSRQLHALGFVSYL